MAEAVQKHMSVEEYLEFEKDSEVRHEYVGGVAYAMTGGSGRHNRISLNTARKLADAAEGTPCRVYMSDMKVSIPKRPFYYPDVMVVCGEEPEHPYYFVEDPCLIVEVASPNTENTDRREKLEAYKALPTLVEYLIVSQDARKVERHFRDENDEWWKAEITEEGSFTVPCPPNARLSLADIYENT